MRILLLGYGKEGKAVEKYFKKHDKNAEIEIWQDFTAEDLEQKDFSAFDYIFRSPSVPPLPKEKVERYEIRHLSSTKYFFAHCPCKIIGVTATKGKGTTCSFIKTILDAEGEDAYLVGNIGEPAINILDILDPTSVVVYEMSSFQLWDLKTPPNISVIGTIEPDHLNVHKDFNDYVEAKANICRHQTSRDYCIYYKDNPDSVRIADTAKRPFKVPYPFDIPEDIKSAIKIPGEHNVRNAIAAIAAVACYYHLSPEEYMKAHRNNIINGLLSFQGLPHRLEFVREFDGIKFYDDNFSTNTASTKVALESFPGERIIPIIGGRDKTNYEDLPELYEMLNQDHIPVTVLIGESGHEFYARYQNSDLKSYLILADSLKDAVKSAYYAALDECASIVLMSPAAASFDMFKDVYERGDRFKSLVSSLS